MLSRSFPQQASEWIDPVSRRGFLKMMGASMALAGLAGCTKQPDEPIYPYVKAPEDLVLGKPMYFATAFPVPDRRGSGPGQERRLPADQGRRQSRAPIQPRAAPIRSRRERCSTCTIPTGRSISTASRRKRATWPVFLASFRSMLADKKSSGGAGIYFLSGTVTSPTLAAQWKKAQAAYPECEVGFSTTR